MKIYPLLLIITLFFVDNTLAEINILNEKYSPGEVFQAELNFQNLVEDIKTSDISILNYNKNTENIGVILTKISNEKYFVYFTIPEIQDSNYTLNANNVKYLENGILKKENYEKAFEIKKRNNDVIAVNPVFIKFNPDEKSFFKIDLINKGESTANITVSEEENLTKILNNFIILGVNSENSFYIDINKNNLENKDRIDIKINNYILPVYIVKENKEKLKFFIESEDKKIYLNSYDVNIPFGNYGEGSLFIENNLDSNLKNLTISLTNNLDKVLKLGFYKIDNLESKKQLKLNLFFNLAGNSPVGKYSGDLMIKNLNVDASLPVNINIENTLQAKENKEVIPDIIKSEEKTEVEEEIREPKVQTKKESKISKKNLSYFLIGIIVLVFIIFYFTIFMRTGKSKPKKISELFK